MERERHRSRGRPANRTVAVAQRGLSRRRVVGGALGLAGASAIGAGLARPGGGFADLIGRAATQAGADLCEPAVWASDNGLLRVELVAGNDPARGPGAVAYGGDGHVCEGGGGGFGGLVPGPTLRLFPGDRLKLTLKNRLIGESNATNLHVHGLHVWPIANGDNVFVAVEPGHDFDFEYQIPIGHPTGLFWYHPHHHGMAWRQVSAGLAGAIVIAENPDERPDLRDELLELGARYPGPPRARERLLVLQQLFPAPPTAPKGFVVNGQSVPTIGIRRGEEQRWRLLNASADRFFNLRVVGHRLRRIAVDGNWIPNYGDFPAVDVLPLGPAERAEVLITGAAGAASSYEVRSLLGRVGAARRANVPFFPEEFAGLDDAEMEVDRDYDLLATLVVEAGAAGAAPSPPAATGPIQRAPGRDEPDRSIAFAPPGSLAIDGQRFNPGRVDQTVALGASETWRLVNAHAAIDGWHPFHLHVNDFDVLATSVSGAGVQPPFYQDTVPLPPASPIDPNADPNDPDNLDPGWVEIGSSFFDFTGRFVYHCHFLSHEDVGMMGVVEVVKPVRIDGSGFSPRAVLANAGPTVGGGVNSGTTVVWTNVDGTDHTVTADEIDPLTGRPDFDSGDLAPGRSFAHTFDAPGTVAYHCRRHPGETGGVAVAATQTVEIVGSAFAPAAVEVAVGTTVSWTNRDPDQHTATAADLDPATGAPLFDSGPLDRKASFGHTFADAGVFAYQAAGPPALAGTVAVSEVTRRSVSIGIVDRGFDQPEIKVPAGSTVTWTNRSHTPQTVTGDAGPAAAAPFDSGRLGGERPFSPGRPVDPGQRFSHRFDTVGAVEYFSRLAVSGTIVVDPGARACTARIEIVGGAFAPQAVAIGPGSTVTWTNLGADDHTVSTEGGPFEHALGPGESFAHAFPADEPGPGDAPISIAFFSKTAMRGRIEVV